MASITQSVNPSTQARSAPKTSPMNGTTEPQTQQGTQNAVSQNAAAAAAASSSAALVSLYVGDLNPDISEAQLYEKFTSIGPVMTIRVCRDMITQRSLGYAYVNYQNPTDAEKALDCLNFESIMGRPIRIMWSQRDPSLRRSGVGNIFIKNLDKAIDNKSIYDTFSAFGNILSCKVATDEVGDSKGYGFVHFETEEAARRAIEKVHDMFLSGRRVYVGKFIPKHEREKQLQEQKRSFTNCFVKNFNKDSNEEEIKKMFDEHGDVTSIFLAKSEDGSLKGFGFVNYETTEMAENACTALHDLEYNGRKLYVSRAQKKSERQAELRREFEQRRIKRQKERQNTNLYIKNIDDQIDEDRLQQEFSKFGGIISAKIMRDASGNSRGFGFVSFAKPDEASRAVDEMSNRILVRKPLYVTLAQRKEDRLQQLQSQMLTRLHPQYTRPLQAPAYGGQYFPHPAQQGGFMMPLAPQAPAAPIFRAPAMFPRNVAAWNTVQRPGMRQFPGAGMQGNQINQYGPRGANRNQRQPAGMRQLASQPPQARNLVQHQQIVRANAAGPQGQQASPATGGRPAAVSNVVAQSGMPSSHKAYSAVAAQPAQPSAPQPARSNRPAQQSQQARPSQKAKTESDSIDPAKLANMQPNKQKQVLGEKLYPLVEHLCSDPAYVGKITGMLLESMATTELLILLEENGLHELDNKVEEARRLLVDAAVAEPTVAEPASNGAGDA